MLKKSSKIHAPLLGLFNFSVIIFLFLHPYISAMYKLVLVMNACDLIFA